MDLSPPDVLPPEKLENPAENFDDGLLERCFQAVNKKHFKNQINAQVIWQVPRGTVSIRENPNHYQLSAEDSLVFAKAVKLIEINKPEQAANLLKPLAEAGHQDSQLALCHILKRSQGNWQRYAEMHNAGVRMIKAVPAACYYPETQTIALHPHLHKRNIPQFVLRYLIYHECCHQIVPTEAEDQHPEAFMALERKAPHRERAMQWLEKEGFPTLRNL